MDVVRLTSLATLARLGTVRETAWALGYTPAAVSQHLSQLSREAGADVVRAEGRNVVITEFGLGLLGASAPLLSAQESLHGWLDDENRRRLTRLRIGYFPSAGRLWVPDVIESLRYAGIATSFELIITERDRHLARDTDLDIHVAGSGTVNELDRMHHLLDDPYVIAVPEDHPLAGRRRPVALRALADQNWIDNDTPGGRCRDIFISACSVAGFTPSFPVQAQDYDTALAFVRLGLGSPPSRSRRSRPTSRPCGCRTRRTARSGWLGAAPRPPRHRRCRSSPAW